MISYLYFSNVSSAVIIDSYLQIILPGLASIYLIYYAKSADFPIVFQEQNFGMKKSVVICLFRIWFLKNSDPLRSKFLRILEKFCSHLFSFAGRSTLDKSRWIRTSCVIIGEFQSKFRSEIRLEKQLTLPIANIWRFYDYHQS